MATPQTETTHEPAADRVLRLERSYPAPREALFRAWTEPGELVKWWGPKGFTVPICEMDVRPGGGWRTCMRSFKGNEHCVRGIYREVNPPERLVFTWAWEQGDMKDVETLVTVEFHDRDGATDMVLTHDGLPSVSARDAHDQGWSSSLDCLKDIL